jgi:hypothetical protein
MSVWIGYVGLDRVCRFEWGMSVWMEYAGLDGIAGSDNRF